MSTPTAELHEEHTSQEEVERLAQPKRPARQRIGLVASYVGMGLIVLYCIIPFYWMVVSSPRLPTQGRSTARRWWMAAHQEWRSVR
jgi:multiple sugar transport system permease protein